MIIYYITPCDIGFSAADSFRVRDWIKEKKEDGNHVFSSYQGFKDYKGKDMLAFFKKQTKQMREAEVIYYYPGTDSAWVHTLFGYALTLNKPIYASSHEENCFAYHAGSFGDFCKELEDTNRIKSCPFCGAPGKVRTVDTGGDYDCISYNVTCTGAGEHSLDFCGKTVKEAIDEWNERPE